MTTAPTAQQIRAALTAVQALADAIRELGSVPSGHLYAQVCGHLSLESYNGAIGLLKRSNLVTEDSAHVLRWTGPAL